jgi:Flp pilus assembly protein TadG
LSFCRKLLNNVISGMGVRWREFCRQERGAALVETTLLMPFLLVTCAGVFEFGTLFYQKLLIEAGVRDAARYAARCTLPSVAVCEATAKEIAVFGAPAGTTPRVGGWAPSDVVITPETTANTFDPITSTYDYRGGSTITTIRVTASFTYNGQGMLAFIGFNDITLSAEHEERFIGW